MLKLKDVFNYTLQTGRDLFDDIEQLDRHTARYILGKENKVGYWSGVVSDGLFQIGIDVDVVGLDTILENTVTKEEVVDHEFIPLDDEYQKLLMRDRARFAKENVRKTIISFINSGHFNDELLLNAPYDIAIEVYNSAIKEHNEQLKKRG